MKYSILVIGNIYDNHIIRYLIYLKRENPNAIIDIMSFNRDKEFPEQLNDVVSCVYWVKASSSSNKVMREYRMIKELFSVIKSIGKEKCYDFVNIHFPIEEYFFVANRLRRLGKVMLLTPWGSDIYRSGIRGRMLLKHLFNISDYVCGTGNRFSQDVKCFFNVPEDKFVNLDIGSETIDYISENKSVIDKKKARELLSINDESYVITCGYNAHKEQNHIAILDAVHSVREVLPQDLVLFFPMSYPKDKAYIEEVKLLAKEYSIESVFFENYVSVDKLFLIRQATDMFIHVQVSDANAQSVQEYILLEKNVINGNWIRYSELENNGIPYHVVDGLSNLPFVIESAYKQGGCDIPKETLEYIKGYGWNSWIKKWNHFFETNCG